MGTLWTVTVYAGAEDIAEAAFSASFAELDHLNHVMSDYDPESEVRKLSTDWKPVSPHLAAVLAEAKHVAATTQGAFDPAVGALTKLWRRALRKKEFPENRALQTAREDSGHQLLELSAGDTGMFGRLKRDGVRIDLGGIGKGYALGAVGRLLETDFAITRYLIDAGGDVFAGLAPPGTTGWQVEVRGNGEPFCLTVERLAVATSGDLYQFAEIGGKRFSHLIDPRSGVALTGGASATVIAADPARADALASALCVTVDRRIAGSYIEKLIPEGSVRVGRTGEVPWETGIEWSKSAEEQKRKRNRPP